LVAAGLVKADAALPLKCGTGSAASTRGRSAAKSSADALPAVMVDSLHHIAGAYALADTTDGIVADRAATASVRRTALDASFAAKPNGLAGLVVNFLAGVPTGVAVQDGHATQAGPAWDAVREQAMRWSVPASGWSLPSSLFWTCLPFPSPASRRQATLAACESYGVS
jgi:hypothetical protein